MAITEQMFKEHDPSLKLKSSYSRMTISDKTAFNSGKDAANRVNITSGLGGRRTSETMRLNA
jgi:hypothetical protein